MWKNLKGDIECWSLLVMLNLNWTGVGNTHTSWVGRAKIAWLTQHWQSLGGPSGRFRTGFFSDFCG